MRSQRHRIAELILFTLPMLGAGCATPGPTFEDWEGKIYIGDPINAAIARRQGHDMIRCEEAKFSQFVCLSAADFEVMSAIFMLQEDCK